jgi:hypothetical protein
MTINHAIRAQLRGMSRCAMTGMLAGLLATPTFALSAPVVPAGNQPEATMPNTDATLNTTAEAPDALPYISSDGSTAEESALPEAPAASESASLLAPTRTDLLAAAADGSSTTSTSTTKKHRVRGGFIALGVVGAVAAGMGAYIFSIKTSDTGTRDALGTMFLAPGAAAAGLGFYFAFK